MTRSALGFSCGGVSVLLCLVGLACQPKGTLPQDSTLEGDTDTDTDTDSDSEIERVGDWVDLAVGNTYVCGLKEDGRTLCWGNNDAQQLAVPEAEFVQIEANEGGMFACGLSVAGEVACWGSNSVGQTEVVPGNYREIAVGGNVACGTHPDGQATCWGYSGSDADAPPESPLSNITFALTTACGLSPDGSITCWGLDLNEYGTSTPPAGRYSAVDCGQAACLALDTNGYLVGWGVLGDWDTSPPEDGGYVDIYVGAYMGCAFRSDHSASCWGIPRLVPLPEPTDRILKVGSGAMFACFLHADGQITCSGTDQYCQCFDIPD